MACVIISLPGGTHNSFGQDRRCRDTAPYQRVGIQCVRVCVWRNVIPHIPHSSRARAEQRPLAASLDQRNINHIYGAIFHLN